jgi:putative two-component system response regulator
MTGETLLIVEDNLVLRDGLRDILTFDEFNVLTASNGQEALDLLQGLPAIPDLIISDISMPVMDGFQFYSALQTDHNWEAIPFIFLTARGEKEDILAGKNLGVDDYLVKPVTSDELVTVVRSRLDRSKQVRQNQLHQSMETLLTMLANAIEGRDLYTGGHVERVRDYAQAIAAELGWQGQALEPLLFGAILHDVGKLFVPDNVLNKPGPLDAGEWEIMKQHPTRGIRLVGASPTWPRRSR